MMTPDVQDLIQRERHAAQEQAEANARARAGNVKTFERMWFTLGVDCIKAANSNHRSEFDEALSLASHRWSKLLDMEGQIQREAVALGSRPKKRPVSRGDALIPDRTIAEWEEAWEQQTKHGVLALAQLRELAAAERSELESLVVRPVEVNKRRR